MGSSYFQRKSQLNPIQQIITPTNLPGKNRLDAANNKLTLQPLQASSKPPNTVDMHRKLNEINDSLLNDNFMGQSTAAQPAQRSSLPIGQNDHHFRQATPSNGHSPAIIPTSSDRIEVQDQAAVGRSDNRANENQQHPGALLLQHGQAPQRARLKGLNYNVQRPLQPIQAIQNSQNNLLNSKYNPLDVNKEYHRNTDTKVNHKLLALSEQKGDFASSILTREINKSQIESKNAEKMAKYGGPKEYRAPLMGDTPMFNNGLNGYVKAGFGGQFQQQHLAMTRKTSSSTLAHEVDVPVYSGQKKNGTR